jgi:hypothetical protein
MCHNRELSTRTILFLFFSAYTITWFQSFPFDWATNFSVVGPKPEFENYTALLRQIPEFSDEIPTYILTIKVILSRFLDKKDFQKDSTTISISTINIAVINLFITGLADEILKKTAKKKTAKRQQIKKSYFYRAIECKFKSSST